MGSGELASSEPSEWLRRGLVIGPGLRATHLRVDNLAPIDHLLLNLSSGLTVLFGQNGAGKTTVLEALELALNGIAPDAGVVQLIVEPDDQALPTEDHAARDLIEEHLARDLRFLQDILRSLPDENVAALGGWPDHLPEVVTLPMASSQFEEALALVSGWRRMRGRCVLAFVPVGTRDSPLWRVSIAEWPDDLAHVKQGGRQLSVKWADERRSAGDDPTSDATFDWYSQLSSNGWRSPAWPIRVKELFAVGEYDDEPLLGARGMRPCVTVSDAADDLDSQTSKFVDAEVRRSGDRLVTALIDEEVVHSSQLLRVRSMLMARAQALLDALGIPVIIELRIREHSLWTQDGITEWVATDQHGSTVAVAFLGGGHRRWVRAAINMALAPPWDTGPMTLLVDEPELALHLAAQRDLAAGLARITGVGTGGRWEASGAVVASHSPVFLAEPHADLVHIARDWTGNVTARPLVLDPAQREVLDDLGLTPVDVLATSRVILLVEGLHDVAVVKQLFGPELRALRAIVLPINGAKNLESVVNARILLDYTDARIRIVLDGVGAHGATLFNGLATMNPKDHASTIEQIRAIGMGETRWLAEAARRAIERKVLHRLDVVGLERPDIIDYLPVDRFVSGDESWDQLHEQHERATGGTQRFKQWLITTRGAQINVQAITAAAADLDDLGDLPTILDGL